MNGRRDRKTVARILENKKKPLIKICGLTDSRAAAAAVDADFSGFVFAKSRRQIAPEAAAELLSEADPDTISVGVFVDESTREILRSIEIAGIDAVQLHGNEPDDQIEELHSAGIYVIRAFRMPVPSEQIERSPADLVLLDSGKPGSGHSFDWKNIAIKRDYLLAGGLSAENLEQAEKYGPAGFDISSGAETYGIKYPDKIKEILQIGNELKQRREAA